jgi:hypothetical protein
MIPSNKTELISEIQKHFGFLIGWLMYIVNFREFEINYCDSEDVGYIEFVGLKQKFQGQGFAS